VCSAGCAFQLHYIYAQAELHQSSPASVTLLLVQVFDDKLNILQVDELVVGLIAFNLVAALLPASGTFVPDPEVGERRAGGGCN
jgi:hypothetical protein